MLSAKLYSAASGALRPWVPSQSLAPRPRAPRLLAPQPHPPVGLTPVRHMDLGLKSQYSNNTIPKRLHITYAMTKYWETIPLFFVCFVDLVIVAGATAWAFKTRVDIQLTHPRGQITSISRNMDLRNPSILKHLVYYQRYEPWPEMQDVLDKMSVAEKRAMSRAESCSGP